MTRRLVVLTIMLAAFAASAYAQIYSNGPINGTTDAWTINFGFAVSDSFPISTETTASSISFGAWLFPGDVLESAEVLIGTSEFGGTIFDSIVRFSQSNCSGNQYGFNVCVESGSFGSVNLPPGTLWLTIENATVNTGDPIYWDENSGPSMASENSVGTIPSEAFTLGGACCGPPPTVPEPSSILLLASGTLGILGSWRMWGRK